MNIEHQQSSVLLLPHIIQRQIHKKVIIRLSHLQEALTTGYILEECGRIPPYTVRRAHIHRSIKLPTGPGSLGGRIGRAMEKRMIDAGNEHEVDIRLTLRQRRTEMLRQPSKSLRRSIRFAGDMSARRSVFQHREVGVIGTRQRILTQSPYTEIG